MSEVSLDELRKRIELRREHLDTLQRNLDDLKDDVRDARASVNDATRDFNVAVAATKPKRKSPTKKVDTGAAFHVKGESTYTPAPESKPSQVDLEEAIADVDKQPAYRPAMVA